MADPWLAHEVLGELDQAGVCYFALTLRMAHSRTYLEIPATFTEETGWPVFEQCALVTSLDFSKEWPLKLHRKSDVHTGVSAVSVGCGWSKFVADHHLGDGAFLTFEVVDSRTLVVALLARGGIDSSYQRPSREPLHPTASQHPRGDHVPPPDDIGDTHLTIPGVLTPVACGHRSQFQKTLRKTHMKKNDGGRLDVPTEYWCTHGVEAFNGKWYTLVGPITTWSVKSATHASKKQTFCSFTKGFAGFCAANDLKLGETLQFTKVAPLTFEVRKV